MDIDMQSGSDIASFQAELLRWFDQARRDFPWRSFRDPYAVLVAEKLLQQTAARSSVVEAYETILQQYPTAARLAAADVVDIERIIRPLGFTYRARELVALGQEIAGPYNGVVPRDLKALLALPGVGDYAARAVLSFAYGEDVPIVDTNVARFLYRIYGISGKLPANPARKRSLIELAAQLVPPGRSKDWNLAILDLCALICVPSKPKCPDCPVRSFCEYGTAATAIPPN